MSGDFVHAFRWLARNPLFAASVTAILALGIGAGTAVFSIVDAVLLRPGPYESPARLVKIEETSTKRTLYGIPAQDYLEFRGRNDLFEAAAAHLRDDVTITGVGEPDQVISRRVSVGLFSLLGVRARLGRTLMESDGRAGAPNAAVLSDRLWRRKFQGDPGAVGRTFMVGDEAYTVVGVMPPEFEFPYADVAMWIPLRLTPASTGIVQGVVARMKPGVSLTQVQAAMNVIAGRLEQEAPERRAGMQIPVSLWRDDIGIKYEKTLVLILAAVGLVLLIACADVAGLLLSRAVQRQKEIAIRASLGAGFWRVLRQLLAESFALAVTGTAAGIAMAHYTLQILTRQIAASPIALPHLQRVAINPRVLLFNTAVCLLLACFISLAPVLFARRTDLQAALRGGQGGGGPRPARWFSILIAAETAFAFLLLAGSGLMIRSLIRLQQADHGFHSENVLTMRVPIGSLTQNRPSGKYDTKPRQMAYYYELVERLHQVPGVRAAAIVNNLPLSGVNTSTEVGPTRTISPHYFSVMGIPLIVGRFFTNADHAGSAPVAIVNEYLARKLFRGRSPIGEKLPSSDSSRPLTVVGVVKDSSQMSYELPAKEEVYLPYRQTIFGVFLSTIVVRTSGDPMAIAAALRKEVWAVDPNQPIVKVRMMDDVIADSIWRPRFSAWIFSVLGGLALVLTSAGVYAVVAYTSRLRVREFGIRVALGATPREVVAVVLRGALIPVAAGLAVSLAAALLLGRLLRAFCMTSAPSTLSRMRARPRSC